MRDRFHKIRTYSLMALHTALGILALLLIFASFQFWQVSSARGDIVTYTAFILSATLMMFSNFRESRRLLRLRQSRNKSAIRYAPFIFAMTTLLLAGTIFTSA